MEKLSGGRLPMVGAVPPNERATVEQIQEAVDEIAPGAVASPVDPLPATPSVPRPPTSLAGLLGDIQRGKALRKVEDTPRPREETLFDQIKRGTKLKKVEDTPRPKKEVKKDTDADKEAKKDADAKTELSDAEKQRRAMDEGLRRLMDTITSRRTKSRLADSSDSESDDDAFTDGVLEYGHFPSVLFRPPARRHGLATAATAAATSDDISADSRKFAETMHECVLDLATNLVAHWYPQSCGRSQAEIVRLAAGERAGEVKNALDLLGAMAAQMVRR